MSYWFVTKENVSPLEVEELASTNRFLLLKHTSYNSYINGELFVYVLVSRLRKKDFKLIGFIYCKVIKNISE